MTPGEGGGCFWGVRGSRSSGLRWQFTLQIRHINGFIKIGLLVMETQKWGPVVTNHMAIGVGPLRHHKSSCCERSTDLITTKVKVKRVLSFIFFSVALSSVWKNVCICFNTMALFLLWFHPILTGRETRSDKNIVLSQPGESFSDLKLKRCSRVTWGCFKIHVRTQKK